MTPATDRVKWKYKLEELSLIGRGSGVGDVTLITRDNWNLLWSERNTNVLFGCKVVSRLAPRRFRAMVKIRLLTLSFTDTSIICFRCIECLSSVRSSEVSKTLKPRHQNQMGFYSTSKHLCLIWQLHPDNGVRCTQTAASLHSPAVSFIKGASRNTIEQTRGQNIIIKHTFLMYYSARAPAAHPARPLRPNRAKTRPEIMRDDRFPLRTFPVKTEE